MTRYNIVILSLASVALIGSLSSVAAFECSESMVGYTYPYTTPTLYYTCQDATTPLLLSCPSGTGYINSGSMAGCVPWQLWNCTSKADPPVCTTSNIGSLYPTTNPETYWSCLTVGAPTLMNCTSGTAFQEATTSCSGSGGCVDWATWWTTCPN